MSSVPWKIITSVAPYLNRHPIDTRILLVGRHDPRWATLVEFPHSAIKQPLDDGCVRLRPLVVAQSTSNLMHITATPDLLMAFPTPAELPAPWNDPAQFSLLPTFGFAMVVDSKIPSLPAGAVLTGLCPFANVCFDVCLEERMNEYSVWDETSLRRMGRGYWKTYREDRRNYWISTRSSLLEYPRAAMVSLEQMGYEALLKPFWLDGQEAFHRVMRNYPGNIVLVSIRAAEIAARAFAWYIKQRRGDDLPWKFLQISEDVSSVELANRSSRPLLPELPLRCAGTRESDMRRGLRWLCQPPRDNSAYSPHIHVVDFTPSNCDPVLVPRFWTEAASFSLPERIFYIAAEYGCEHDVPIDETRTLYADPRLRWYQSARVLTADVRLQWIIDPSDIYQGWARITQGAQSYEQGLVCFFDQDQACY